MLRDAVMHALSAFYFHGHDNSQWDGCLRGSCPLNVSTNGDACCPAACGLCCDVRLECLLFLSDSGPLGGDCCSYCVTVLGVSFGRTPSAPETTNV